MKNQNLIKFTAGILLWPLVLAAFRAFLTQLGAFTNYKGSVQYYFFGGFLSYLAFQFVFFKPIRTYVFGHELTHALWSILFGGRVKDFTVKATSGKVVLTKTNFLINLAPYFFPLYTFIVVIIHFILQTFDLDKRFFIYIIFALGFTFSFHLSLLIYAFSLGQSDVKKTGRVFSLTLVALFNIIVAVLILKIIVPDIIQVLEFGRESWQNCRDIWLWIGSSLTELKDLIFKDKDIFLWNK